MNKMLHLGVDGSAIHTIHIQSREPENTALLINMIGTPAIANISLDPC